jgi:hypothetical protein
MQFIVLNQPDSLQTPDRLLQKPQQPLRQTSFNRNIFVRKAVPF